MGQSAWGMARKKLGSLEAGRPECLKSEMSEIKGWKKNVGEN
jgi:hypothetical protein